MSPKSIPMDYTEEETERRRDATLLRMLTTPPKPHNEMKLGKPRAKKVKSPGRKRLPPSDESPRFLLIRAWFDDAPDTRGACLVRLQ